MYFRILFIVTVTCSLLGWSCHNSPTQPVIGTIGLKAYDVGVVDVTLDVHFNSTARQYQIKLGRTVVASGTARGSDTLVFIDSLLPQHAYTFRAVRLDSGSAVDSSDALAVHTMDTTSHNISWQVTHLAGQGGTSLLYDVAVVNDTCVYAVGKMFINDSAGSGDGPFALATWNGKQWKLSEVIQEDYGGASFHQELKSLLAFSANDVWAAGDAGLMQWNGSSWTQMAFFIQGLPWTHVISKMWGSSDTSIYLVGAAGAVYHYTGTGWKLLNTGTTTDFTDIYGMYDSTTNSEQIYAVAGNPFESYNFQVFSIVGDSITQIPASGIAPYSPMYSVWFKPRSLLYLVGSGVYYAWPRQSWQLQSVPNNNETSFSEEIRGGDRNDVFVVGDFGDLIHFNGESWFNYKALVGNNVGSYHAVAAKGNLIVAVGYSNDQTAAVAVGKRN
jgi:hypothetical protein